MSEPKSDKAVIETRDDREMLRRPHLWSGGGMKGILPLRRRLAGDVDSELGFIWSGQPLVVRRGNIYTLAIGNTIGSFPASAYESVDHILAAGWKVD